MLTVLALIASFMTRPQLRVARQQSLRPVVTCSGNRQQEQGSTARRRSHTGRLKKAAAEMPPLNVQRYGRGACLHVAPTGVRRVCRTTELPGQPKRSVRLVIISDTHSQLDAVTIPAGDILCHHQLDHFLIAAHHVRARLCRGHESSPVQLLLLFRVNYNHLI